MRSGLSLQKWFRAERHGCGERLTDPHPSGIGGTQPDGNGWRYVRCFDIIAGETRLAHEFESHLPHRASPGRVVLTWGNAFSGALLHAVPAVRY